MLSGALLIALEIPGKTIIFASQKNTHVKLLPRNSEVGSFKSNRVLKWIQRWDERWDFFPRKRNLYYQMKLTYVVKKKKPKQRTKSNNVSHKVGYPDCRRVIVVVTVVPLTLDLISANRNMWIFFRNLQRQNQNIIGSSHKAQWCFKHNR